MNEGEFTKVAHAIVEADKEFKVNHPVYLFQRYGEILAKYHDTILAALEIAERGKWVKCEERLPEESATYLAICFEGDAGSDLPFSVERQGWNCLGDRRNELFPTHWMPLPLPPEEK